MAGYRDLLARVKEEIDEISTIEAHERLASSEAPLFVDVREPDEWEEGHIPGAIYTGRGRLEQRIEGLVPDKSRELVVYCSAGSRSAFAAKALGELGYENVVNLAGGFSDWKRNGFDVTIPRVLSGEQRSRYSRHLLIPEVGEDGQQRLLDARVLLVGAGGLGSPVLALPRRRGRRHARHRRRGRRRRVEPPAPDRPLDRPARRAEGALREADARGAEPGRERRPVPGAADLGEHRADPRPTAGT